MRTVVMQYSFNGEKHPLWKTSAPTLEKAWEEMDEKPAESGWIMFDDDDEIMPVNGGFDV